MNELELLSRYRQVEPVDPTLIDATIEAVLDLPDGNGDDRPLLPGGGRRPWRRVVLAGVSVAAAAAVTAVAASGLTGSAPRRPAPEVPGMRGTELAVYVVHRSLAALETASGYVEQVVDHDPRGTVTTWRGPNQFLAENPGKIASLETWASDGSSTVLSVDYQHHTWYKAHFSPPPPPIGSPPPTLLNVSPVDAFNGAEPSAATIVGWFRQPGTQLIGTATIDGTPVYQMRIPAPDVNGNPVSGESITAWVDVTTYLPVRVVREMPAGQGMDHGVRVTIPAFTATEDFTWQPASPQSLAVFDLVPPAGFRQVVDPALQPISPGR